MGTSYLDDNVTRGGAVGNPNGSASIGSGIQSLLYVALIVHKKYRVDEIAAKMGISADCLYRYAEGRNLFPAERIADLIRATGDREYLDYINERAGFIAVPLLHVAECKKSIRKLEVDIAIADGVLLDAAERAMDDGDISKAEMKDILAKATAAIRQIEMLKDRIKARVGGK